MGRTKKVKCIMCDKETEVPLVNEPWCPECIEIEGKRSREQDYLGGFRYSRPPRYVIPKESWTQFGYEQVH